MKKEKIIPYGSMTLPQRIVILERELARAEKALPLYHYFKAISRQKNSYVVELRRVVVLRLLEEGYSKHEVSKVICKSHSTVLHLLKIKSHVEVEITVALYNRIWIRDKQYPMIRRKLVPDSDHKTGFTSVLNYYLKDIK